MKKKFYYLIEEIDIDGDKNYDGFIITKYKINHKTMDKIFMKTKYVTIKDFQKKALEIRLKEDIKLLNNIKNKKNGGMLEPTYHIKDQHQYSNHTNENNQKEKIQQLLQKLEELQTLQKQQEYNGDNKNLDTKNLIHRLEQLEIQLQKQNIQQLNKHNLMHNQQLLVNNREFDNYMNNKNMNNTPQVIISSHKPTMKQSIMEGFGLGLGFSLGDNVVDSVFDTFF